MFTMSYVFAVTILLLIMSSDFFFWATILLLFWVTGLLFSCECSILLFGAMGLYVLQYLLLFNFNVDADILLVLLELAWFALTRISWLSSVHMMHSSSVL